MSAIATPYTYGARRRAKKIAIPTVEAVSEAIDSISRPAMKNYLAQDSAAALSEKALTGYLALLPKGFDRRSLSDLYENRIVALSEAGDADSLLSVCVSAAGIGDAEMLPVACEGVVQVMAVRGDADGLRRALKRLSFVSDSTSVASLAKEYDDILNPVPFEDLVRGTWISPTLMTKGYACKHFPYYTFTINNLSRNDGIRLNYIPGETDVLNNSEIYQLLPSQIVGGSYGNIIAAFGTEKMKQGDDALAQSGFETTREFRARNRAAIASSKASTADKVGATVATELVAGFLDGLFSSSAESYKHVAALNMNLRMETPRLMYGDTEYYNYTVNTNNIGYRPTPETQKNLMFVKWESNDSVYFVNRDNRVFTMTPGVDISEYNAIMEKYSYKKAKYWIPTAAGLIGGAALTTGGFIMAFNSFENDEFGNPVYDENGDHKLNVGKMTSGIIIAVAGIVGGTLVPSLVYQKRVGDRDKALTELNERQLRKLENKARMEIAPAFDPVNRAAGFSALITF